MKLRLCLTIHRAKNGFVLQVDRAPRNVYLTKAALMQDLAEILEPIDPAKITVDYSIYDSIHDVPTEHPHE